MLAAIRAIALGDRLAIAVEYGVIAAIIGYIAMTGINGLNPPI